MGLCPKVPLPHSDYSAAGSPAAQNCKRSSARAQPGHARPNAHPSFPQSRRRQGSLRKAATPDRKDFQMTTTAIPTTLRRAVTYRSRSAELREIDRIYDRLDAEWLAAGKTTRPERQPFAAEDIIEWRMLTPDERIKGLRAYAWASDRIAASERTTQPLAA